MLPQSRSISLIFRCRGFSGPEGRMLPFLLTNPLTCQAPLHLYYLLPHPEIHVLAVWLIATLGTMRGLCSLRMRVWRKLRCVKA
ncbi:hypothetical protein CC86DRAFT_197232 [Ophiobolus disseminans]|uniref:Uncharacterized protein n=1 Tax=Ophiobolus disseminans TaxID=1469910 RepID=A0A6A7A7Z7_9PLEO|nr:hypothetical protein CC86DRAFT_197232 [Ophiobolus disseminans]